MPLNFSPFEVLLLIGITQGFLIAGSIWLNQHKSVSKLLLSGILVVFNFLCIKILIHTTGLWNTPYFRYLPLAFELAIQPLIWLYIASLTKPNFKLHKRYLLHFVPCVISLAYSVAVYLATISRVALEAKDAIANSFYFNPVKEVEDYLSVVSAVIYWMAGSRLVLQYRRWLYANISQTDYPTYAWLRNIMLLMGVLIIGLTVAVTLDYLFHFGALYFIHWQIFFVYMAMLVYYLGFKGAQIPDKKFAFIQIGDESEKKPEPFFQEIDGGQEVGLQETTIASISQTEEELKLSEEKKQQVKEAIRKALETDEMYLDPELNLQKLAKAVQTSPAIVSAVINNSFQKSFRNLINEYRVEKVKQRLTEPASNQFSILGIAYECGFNSEASFYRIFKATVGISPKEYINQFRSLQ